VNDAVQQWMETYALRPEPQHLTAVLRSGAAAAADPYVVACFPAFALRAAPPAGVALFANQLSREDERTRAFGALALTWSGRDASPLLETLSPEWRTRVAGTPAPPSRFPEVTADGLPRVPPVMDVRWCEFMATGRPEPLRDIVELLRFRADDAAVAKAVEANRKGKAQTTVTDAFARGTIYRVAGWSLSSFARGAGPAADYVAAWRDDPGTDPIIRDELKKLFTNPSFRR
jgi:hypothetical protein